jgi:hypothetical protein
LILAQIGQESIPDLEITVNMTRKGEVSKPTPTPEGSPTAVDKLPSELY